MQIYKKAQELVDQKYNIFISWILDYNKVKKNERANKAAKRAALKKKMQIAKLPNFIILGNWLQTKKQF